MPTIDKSTNEEQVAKSASGDSDWIILDTNPTAGLMLGAIASGTNTYDIEVAYETPSSVTDDTVASAPLSTMTGLTASSDPSFLAACPPAVRITITSYTSGTVKLYTVQPSDRARSRG